MQRADGTSSFQASRTRFEGHRVLCRQESRSVEVAERLNDDIAERFDLLGSYPEAGRARDDLGAGRRTFPVGNYVILYRVRGKDVLILRVAHGRRDLDTLFQR